MLIEETFINQTKGYRFGESGPIESGIDDIGELFRSLQREYGRCVSKVYVDKDGGPGPIPVGWVFEKLMPYEDDSTDFYTREVWVTCLERADEVTRKRFPLDISKRRSV